MDSFRSPFLRLSITICMIGIMRQTQKWTPEKESAYESAT